jgi:hypothetical protein
MTYLFSTSFLLPLVFLYASYAFLIFIGMFAVPGVSRARGNIRKALALAIYLLIPSAFNKFLTVILSDSALSGQRHMFIALYIALFIAAPVVTYLRSKKLLGVSYRQAALLAFFWGTVYIIVAYSVILRFV